MYDLIGDIHGHADELVQLLGVLGYSKSKGAYRHPDRKVIFLGDFIDRGSKIRQVLETVRPMVEAGTALTVMGNHEWNALAFHTEDCDAPGKFLRRHSRKNVAQLSQTHHQLKPGELTSYLKWFRTLPMWLDLDGLRVVHACWNDEAISTLQQSLRGRGGITTEFLQTACKAGNHEYHHAEEILRGKKAPLPNGIVFEDKEGEVRTKMRTRWYLAPDGHTYETYSFESTEISCSHELHPNVHAGAAPYPATAKPVFIGHYWLNATQPVVLADNVACLDFSVANGGFLCAYRWNGEHKLNNANFVWVESSFSHGNRRKKMVA